MVGGGGGQLAAWWAMYSSTSDFQGAAAIQAEQAAFMRKVYAIMAAGLALTGAVAFGVSLNAGLVRSLFVDHRWILYVLLGVEFLMVISFAAVAQRSSALVAGALFFSYAAVNGVTFSVVFLRYTTESIASTFFITGGTFAVMSGWGYVTKRELSGLGHFAMMGLVGLLLASLVNFFLKSEMVYWLTTFMGIIVFTGLTAYDTQRIKELNVLGNAGTDEDHKEAIHGALVLYLDFVNLFLELLRLFGRRR